MFIAALFTIAKLWKQPRCPTTDEWIKEMWYLYTMDFFFFLWENFILGSTASYTLAKNFPDSQHGRVVTISAANAGQVVDSIREIQISEPRQC
jgi:hypothetical protein